MHQMKENERHINSLEKEKGMEKPNLKKEDARNTPRTEKHPVGMPAFLYKETHSHYWRASLGLPPVSIINSSILATVTGLGEVA